MGQRLLSRTTGVGSSEVERTFGVGTGSTPCPPHGWHRAMRRVPSQPPRMAPYVSIASIVYCEHVGQQRHREVLPDAACWYPRVQLIIARATGDGRAVMQVS